MVGVFGKERLGQITMGEMQLQPLEASVTRTASGCDEILTHTGNVFQRHGLRLLGQVTAKSYGRWSDGLPATGVIFSDVVIAFPWTVCACLATGVGDLQAGDRAGCLDRLHHRYEGLGQLIVPNTRTARSDPPFWRYSGCFDNHQPRPATRKGGVVNTVPLVDQAIV
ncbi:hypothetical protein PAERUG_P53_London_9_VIM_2_02_13_05504 [Pseudomonas aeruginosa]|nr:hypothetical protein PAERUG_P5_London_26_VIM_2_01_09_04698 [Pseudomonas aeruginosa]CRX18581.1 hypothetical protein PAERUG_P53_London_9_VIM_2_02_13_05504 [Pseudomonas aeruginosa]CRX24454.1 hypothetical protein PAERUG_P54_1_London_24_VIM_2_04_13_04009 [Pseudomonas aeruginosa]